MTALYILISILIFGFMIFTHELGHYLFARLFHVKIYEFSLGMGPKLLSRISKKTEIRYSLRLFPIGGFVSMAGEDEETEEENALTRKPVWQRMIITAAGGFVNIVIGLLATVVLVANMNGLGSTVIHHFTKDDSPTKASGLCEEDEVLKVDGARVHISADLSYQILHRGGEPVDVVVRRGNDTLTIKDVTFPTFTDSGHVLGEADFIVYGVEKTPWNVIRYAFWESVNTVRMVYESLFDLITGTYGVKDLSGPVGVTKVITQAAEQGAQSLLNIFVFISVNLGIFNLLPLPALDGGRLVFQLIELVFRKPVPRRVEAGIHLAGLMLLLLLMVFISVKDVIGLVRN